jgi:hypothetical protein
MCWLRFSARAARPMFGHADHPEPVSARGRRLRFLGADRQSHRVSPGVGANPGARARVRSTGALNGVPLPTGALPSLAHRLAVEHEKRDSDQQQHGLVKRAGDRQ